VIIDWHVIAFPDRYPRGGAVMGLLPTPTTPIRTRRRLLAEIARSFGRDPAWISVRVRSYGSAPASSAAPQENMVALNRRDPPVTAMPWCSYPAALRSQASRAIRSTTIASLRLHAYPPEDSGRPGRWFEQLDDIHRVRPSSSLNGGFCRSCPNYIRGTPHDSGVAVSRSRSSRSQSASTAWCWSAAPLRRCDRLGGDDDTAARAPISGNGERTDAHAKVRHDARRCRVD